MAVSILELDHLVLTCPRLEDGVRHVEDRLGARPIQGGKHPKMGTHNALLRIGERAYLEVIAPDPDAPPPGRQRWFELDILDPCDSPRLATWVARSSDLASPNCPIEVMSRGDFRWRLTVPSDGRLLAQGVVPYLIDWEASPHPAETLPPSGRKLHVLELAHPEPAVVAELRKNLSGGLSAVAISLGELHIAATFETPHGMAVL